MVWDAIDFKGQQTNDLVFKVVIVLASVSKIYTLM